MTLIFILSYSHPEEDAWLGPKMGERPDASTDGL